MDQKRKNATGLLWFCKHNLRSTNTGPDLMLTVYIYSDATTTIGTIVGLDHVFYTFLDAV
jgi:hypothetical protein